MTNKKRTMKEKALEKLRNELACCKARSERFREELEILYESWKILLKIEVGHYKENERLRKKLYRKIGKNDK